MKYFLMKKNEEIYVFSVINIVKIVRLIVIVWVFRKLFRNFGSFEEK